MTEENRARVSIVGVDLSIGAMAWLFLKMAIASIPALLVLFAVSYLLLMLQIALRGAIGQG